VTDDVTVHGRTNVLMGVSVSVFPVILASTPLGSGIVRAVWVLLMLGLVALGFWRAARMGVSAGPPGLAIRNFGRDYEVPWAEVAAIDASQSDNITGAATTIVIRRADGTKLVGRGASSFSRRAVERWRDELVAAHQGNNT
jgi:hypothetical protein